MLSSEDDNSQQVLFLRHSLKILEYLNQTFSSWFDAILGVCLDSYTCDFP